MSLIMGHTDIMNNYSCRILWFCFRLDTTHCYFYLSLLSYTNISFHLSYILSWSTASRWRYSCDKMGKSSFWTIKIPLCTEGWSQTCLLEHCPWFLPFPYGLDVTPVTNRKVVFWGEGRVYRDFVVLLLFSPSVRSFLLMPQLKEALGSDALWRVYVLFGILW